ncbi:MAG: serine/threonine-protein kinase [Myxococcota bacterium]
MEPVGRVFGGDFRILAPLDEGGMGELYEAEQLSTGERRAVKLMHQRLLRDEALRVRFVREASMSALVESEHVVQVIAAGVEAESGRPWLAMELLEGRDLSSYLTEHGPLPIDEVTALLRQICHGLGAAHRVGVVHRDLKPRNVFVLERKSANASPGVKVLDFGIAKVLTRTTVTGTETLGSPGWMAPEQSDPSAPITPATDIWSLGLLVFKMLTGRPFWLALNGAEGTLEMLLREVILDPMPSACERAACLEAPLSSQLDPWFARCVARDPAARYPNATVAFEAFESQFSAGEAPIAVPGRDLGVESRTLPAPSLGREQPTVHLPPLAGRGTAARPAEEVRPRRDPVAGRRRLAGALVSLLVIATVVGVVQPPPTATLRPFDRAWFRFEMPPVETAPSAPKLRSSSSPPSPSAEAISPPASPTTRPRSVNAWHRQAMHMVNQRSFHASRQCGKTYRSASVQYAVAPDGRVLQLVVTTSPPRATQAETCVRAAMSIPAFPAPGVPRTLSTMVMAM